MCFSAKSTRSYHHKQFIKKVQFCASLRFRSKLKHTVERKVLDITSMSVGTFWLTSITLLYANVESVIAHCMRKYLISVNF